MKLPQGNDLKKARHQKIPLLTDFLEIAKNGKKYIIFDLNGPPKYHPYRHSFVRKTVEVVLASKIEQHLVCIIVFFYGIGWEITSNSQEHRR